MNSPNSALPFLDLATVSPELANSSHSEVIRRWSRPGRRSLPESARECIIPLFLTEKKRKNRKIVDPYCIIPLASCVLTEESVKLLAATWDDDDGEDRRRGRRRTADGDDERRMATTTTTTSVQNFIPWTGLHKIPLIRVPQRHDRHGT